MEEPTDMLPTGHEPYADGHGQDHTDEETLVTHTRWSEARERQCTGLEGYFRDKNTGIKKKNAKYGATIIRF